MASRELNRWYEIGRIPPEFWNHFRPVAHDWLAEFIHSYMNALASYFFQKQMVTLTDEFFAPPALGIVVTEQIPARRMRLMRDAFQHFIKTVKWKQFHPDRIRELIERVNAVESAHYSGESRISNPCPVMLESFQWSGSVLDRWPEIWIRLWIPYFQQITPLFPPVSFSWTVGFLNKEIALGTYQPGLALFCPDPHIFDAELNSHMARLNAVINLIKVYADSDLLNPAGWPDGVWPGR